MNYNIHKTYEQFRHLHMTTSQYDFSKRWLGQCASYLSAIKASGAQPGLFALLTLAYRMNSHLASIQSPPASMETKQFPHQLWMRREIEAINAHCEQRLMARVAHRLNITEAA